jgi:hypothetical protein
VQFLDFHRVVPPSDHPDLARAACTAEGSWSRRGITPPPSPTRCQEATTFTAHPRPSSLTPPEVSWSHATLPAYQQAAGQSPGGSDPGLSRGSRSFPGAGCTVCAAQPERTTTLNARYGRITRRPPPMRNPIDRASNSVIG